MIGRGQLEHLLCREQILQKYGQRVGGKKQDNFLKKTTRRRTRPERRMASVTLFRYRFEALARFNTKCGGGGGDRAGTSVG